jgi:hypothetical protein
MMMYPLGNSVDGRAIAMGIRPTRTRHTPQQGSAAGRAYAMGTLPPPITQPPRPPAMTRHSPPPLQAAAPMPPPSSANQTARNKWSLDDLASGDARQPLTAAAPYSPRVDDLLQSQISAPYGRSLMPGVVQRGNVTNVVGIPTDSPMLDAITNDRISRDEIRRNETASRVAANHAKQLENNVTRLQQWGYAPDQPFIGGKEYVEGDGYKGISNHAAARKAMSPQQRQTFDERKVARQAELDLRKQRQFARAQFREAAAGRGAIYQDGGALDLAGTMATQAFGRDPKLGIDAALGLDTNDLKREQIKIKDLIAQAGIKNAERQFTIDAMLAQNVAEQGRYGRSEEAHDRAMELAGFDADAQNEPTPLEKSLEAVTGYASLSPIERRNVVDAEARAILLNPNDTSDVISESGVTTEDLLNQLFEDYQNPNLISPMSDADKAAMQERIRMREAALRARGIEPPKYETRAPYLWDTLFGNPLNPDRWR